jgi:hypothetical protein
MVDGTTALVNLKLLPRPDSGGFDVSPRFFARSAFTVLSRFQSET